MTSRSSGTSGGYAHLAADRVSKWFGVRRSSRFKAVDDVSFAFDTSTMIGIVGESGSGKSSLARMLVGLDSPSTGTILFNGEPIGTMLTGTSGRLAFRRAVQFVGQDTTSSFDPRRTLRDAVRHPAEVLLGLDKRQGDARVDEVLEKLGLPSAMADRKPSGVSGGQRQRFAIARALVVHPRLLICDEVVSALDVSVQGSILNLLKQHCRSDKVGLVFVSHGLPATAFISEEIVVMLAGRIVEQGPTSKVLSHPDHAYTAQMLAAHQGKRSPQALVTAGPPDPSVRPVSRHGGGR
jgi:peptide/nickel transport system ATP-binding protein